ncbi:hypothetical protein GCM10010266_67190 [Streptomyces griseomycini]|uniref:TnpA family transposase n=1 Tax=Streptomyces griseomycini TaxID=66895 RepID=A0A7W7PX13_9ACTN|nr:TnpA family transposase [Streptomyces griseomycini]GGQ34518.1 hypothetical protein GCM10010266_67190 [Streptomyces griseomycini]GGR51402.1 hypothetical protein GCM10015536_66160 [Streptomyces griseomycini]
MNDQVAGIGAMVVRGTPRDSLFTLDTLLNLDGGVRPETVATDNASYSDMAFGLYKMLGFRFAPRFRDLADQRFWRADVPVPEGEEPAGDHGPLEAIARHKVSLKRIETHWPDTLRVAGSLITNQVRAYDLLRMFGREGHPTPLGAAFAEYGRIDKAMHLLALVDPMDDTYRRLVNRQLTVQESRHRLARAICHGGRGQIRQAYRDGQEDQLAALGLVLKAVVLGNTRYVDAAVAQLRAEGHDIKDEDLARLSPLKNAHINFLGRYLFNIASSGPAQGLRPLRDPDEAEPDDGDEDRSARTGRAAPEGRVRPCSGATACRTVRRPVSSPERRTAAVPRHRVRGQAYPQVPVPAGTSRALLDVLVHMNDALRNVVPAGVVAVVLLPLGASVSRLVYFVTLIPSNSVDSGARTANQS